MSVSSVKNLNGETFSAVQDTFLTDIVSSNSANWNEISAYQANSGDYLTTADSAEFYTTANESGFISEVPAGTMNESAFEYDANDKISGYNGSAFAGGSDIPTGLYVPLSATVVAIGESSNSARWVSMVQGRQNTAQENSFAQGATNSASGISLAQGYANTAVDNSLSQGSWCHAGGYSIAQGASVSAMRYSQAFGMGTIASSTGMAIGKLNKTTTAAFVVGNGTSLSNRSDAFIINHDGSVSAAGKISANGVELGAGTELEFEYDAADNISAINNSAISTTPAQALYAQSPLYFSATGTSSYMGINSADLARILGVDETVLWSGNLTGNGATAQLSEPIQNFERIKVYGHTDDGLQCPWFTEFYPNENTMMDVGVATNNAGWGKWFNFTITTGGLYTNVTGRVLTFGTTTWGNLDTYGLTKVIGIGRKEV